MYSLYYREFLKRHPEHEGAQSQHEFMIWIQGKHRDYRDLVGIKNPDIPYSEEQQKDFERYLVNC